MASRPLLYLNLILKGCNHRLSMVRFNSMKDMVLVPIKFVIFLMAILFAGTAVQVLIDFSRLSPKLQQEGASTISLLIANGFFLWMIPAIGLTWLFSSFSILRTGKGKRTRMIFLTLLVMGTMFSALFLMPPLDDVRSHVSELDFQVPEKTILSQPDAFFVYFGSEGSKNGKVLLHQTDPDARFQVIQGVRKDLQKSELLLGSSGSSILMDSVIGGRQNFFEDPEFMNPVTRAMMNGLLDYQKGTAGNMIAAAILAGATALLLSSFWLFVRLTQWPLANCVLTLLLLCGVILLPAVLAMPTTDELLSFIPLAWKPYLLSGTYVLISLICYGGILLLPSRKDWQAGVNE